MSLNETVSAERLHIGFFGMRNAGKSSVVNAVTGQDLAVVSDVKGTTTDPVKKAMELLPLGPVVILDTPGLDDEGELGLLRVKKARRALAQTDIRVDDNPSISVAEMNAKCRRLDNLGLVLIDYLQLMTSAGTGQTSNNANRVQVVSDISRALKIMAKELNVPVICLSQLSRANESRTDKRPMLSDLRESGAIEQDADEVIFIYRDDYYNPNSEEKNVAEIIVAKNRHGETGTVKVQWLPQFTTFADREWKHSEG